VIGVQRLSDDTFRSWNRRRLGHWKTDARIIEAEVGRRFSFVVQALGGDWTQWTYQLEPHARRTDLQANMTTSVQRIKAIAEADTEENQ